MTTRRKHYKRTRNQRSHSHSITRKMRGGNIRGGNIRGGNIRGGNIRGGNIRGERGGNIRGERGGGGGNSETSNAIEELKKTGIHVLDATAATMVHSVGNVAQNVARSLGVNPNASIETELRRLGETTTAAKNVLQSPYGKQKLEDAKEIALTVSDAVISPMVKKVVDTTLEHSEHFIDKGSRAVLDGLGATPLGPIIELPRFAADVAGIGQTMTSFINQVIDIVQKAVQEGKKSQQELDDILNGVSNAVKQEQMQIGNRVQQSTDGFMRRNAPRPINI